MNPLPTRLLPLLCLPLILAACGEGEDPVTRRYPTLASLIIHRQDQVDVETLADWLTQGRRDFLLLDLRPQAAFEAGHIPSARSMPLSYLVESQTLKRLPRDRKILLYSNGNRKAAQALVMLRLVGFDAYALLGGYGFWVQHILQPEQPIDAGDDEILAYRKRRVMACGFSGDLGEPPPTPASRVLTPPAQTQPPPVRRPAEPIHHEGC